MAQTSLMTEQDFRDIEQANGQLAETIQRNMREAMARVKKRAIGKNWDEANLEALMAFEAMSAAEEERHNLRSMQAWLAYKVGRTQLYLAFPPTQEHPDGFGDMKEWLRAVGIKGSTLYDLDGLAMEVGPLLEREGYKVASYLNKDRYPKLAEAISKLRQVARGEDDTPVSDIMDSVSRAQSRDDVRGKYRQSDYIAEGAVNNLGRTSTIVLETKDEHVETIINALQNKVDWCRTSVAENRKHEVIIHLMKKEVSDE